MKIDTIKLEFASEYEYNRALHIIDNRLPKAIVKAAEIHMAYGHKYWEIVLECLTPEYLATFMKYMYEEE